MSQRNSSIPVSLLTSSIFAVVLLSGFVQVGIHDVSAQTTARTYFEQVQAEAASVASDVELIGVVGSDISPTDGAASSWFYLMQSLDSDALFGLIRQGDEVTSPLDLSEFPDEVTDMFTPNGIDSWLDSDVVMSIAEENGGAAFRSTYPDAIVSALLVGVPTSTLVDLELPPLPAIWVVAYASLTEETFASSIHVIDATFGLHIEIEPTSARENLEVANTSATVFAEDAQLVYVSTLLPDFTPLGTASVWQYTYYSPSLDQSQTIYAASGLVLASAPALVSPPSNEPLPPGWLDSPVAAENAGSSSLMNEFIQSPSLVQARISRGLSQTHESAAFWELNYILVGETLLEVLIEEERLDLSIEPLLIPAENIDTEENLSVFELIDADLDQPVTAFAPIPQEAILDLSLLPQSLNITVSFDTEVDAVSFYLNGTLVNTERVAPYALFGDILGDYNAGALPVGTHELQAKPTTNGTQGDPVIVRFTVVNSQLPSINALYIIDADTDQQLVELTNGASVDANQLPPSVNVSARTSNQVQSVLFNLNAGFYQRLENVAPFALFGDIGGDFLPGTLPAGTHILVVTPYSEQMANGTPGPAFTLEFTVEGSVAKSEHFLHPGYGIEPTSGLQSEKAIPYLLEDNFPNPFNPETNISFNLPETADVRLVVYDALGRQISVLINGTYGAGRHTVQFRSDQLSTGTYFYSLQTPKGVYTRKMLLLR